MKHFAFLLGSTFIIGIFAGIFVYFMSDLDGSFNFNFGGPSADAFEITGDEYGGCQMLGVCGSYRIKNDGSYLYLRSSRDGGDERFEGKIDIDAISREVRNTPLEEVASSEFTGTCPITYDGSAYRYEIRADGYAYRFDTCEQDVSGYRLFELLAEQFNDFYRTH